MPNYRKNILRAVLFSLMPISMGFSTIAGAGVMIYGQNNSPQSTGSTATTTLSTAQTQSSPHDSNENTAASDAPPETPAQKAAILQSEEQQTANAEKAQTEADAANARQTKLAKQEATSINGLGGPYYLPPLPTPSSIRPMVGTQLHEEFPLSTHEIQWVKQQMQKDQYAIHKGAPLKILNPSINVSVGPGAAVPTIHVAQGYVTSISIVGVDGNPWPVTSRKVGGGQSFSVSAVTEFSGAPAPSYGGEKSSIKGKGGTASTPKKIPASLPNNLLTISPKYFGSSSNLMLTLENSNTPLMVNIISDGPSAKTVDGMVTLRLDRHGPNTPPALFQPPPPSAVDADLLLFLAQTPPKSAQPMRVTGGYGVKAWTWDNHVIVRTSIPLLTPAWTAEVPQDGVIVYKLPMTHVLLLRDNMNSTDGSWQARTVLLSNENHMDEVK